MASIKQYETKAGKRWQVQYTKPGGRRGKKRGFATKADATAWVQDQAHTQRTGTWVDPAREKTTVETIGTRWLAAQTHLKPSTAAVTEQAWRLRVKPMWGHRAVGSIRPSEIQEWVASLNVSGSTARRAHACLAQVLDMAIADGCLVKNPARGLKLPRRSKAVKVYLTMEQVRALADQCSVKSEIVWLLATSGIRWSELAGLQVRDLDLGRRRAHLQRAAVTVNGKVEIGTLKSHEARTVAIPRFVCNMLAPLIEGKPKSAWVWERVPGKPMKLQGSGSWFHGARDRAMAADPDFPRVTMHGLRHVAAGLLVSAGASVKVVQRQLGHSSAAMTLDVYADLFDGDLDAVADTMEEIHDGLSALRPAVAQPKAA